MAPTEVSFGLSPSYGIHGARDAHDWFLRMMHEHEEFEVSTEISRVTETWEPNRSVLVSRLGSSPPAKNPRKKELDSQPMPVRNFKRVAINAWRLRRM